MDRLPPCLLFDICLAVTDKNVAWLDANTYTMMAPLGMSVSGSGKLSVHRWITQTLENPESWSQMMRQKVLDQSSQSVLVLAAEKNDIHTCHFIRAWGVYSPYLDALYAAFHAAAKHGHVEILQFLRDWSDDLLLGQSGKPLLTLQGIKSHCTLSVAAMHGHVRVCQFITDWQKTVKHSEWRGYLPEDIPAWNSCALELASSHKQVEVCQFFRDWFAKNTQAIPIQELGFHCGLRLK